MGHEAGAADENMIELWSRLVRAAGGAVEPVHGGLAMTSGIPIPMFNPAFVTADPPDPAQVVDTIRTFFGDRGSSFVVYFRDAVAPSMARACTDAGLVEHWQPPLMVLDPIPAAAPSSPAGLAIEAVDATSYDTYVETLSSGFGIPASIVAPLHDGAMLDIPGFTGLLGRLDGVPVGASGVFVHGDTAGIYNVATIPDHRGRGIGAALTAAAARLGATGGCRRSILQASEAGAPVYRRLGYAVADRYRQFEAAG